MNYKKLYIELIETRKNRILDKNTYTEEHHIFPKSWGGSDDSKNLIKLTAKEHYIAHHLLWKFSKDYRMGFAFMVMSSRIKDKRYFNNFSFITARQFEIARKIHSESLKEFYQELKKDNIKYEEWCNKLKKAANKQSTKEKRKKHWENSENIEKAKKVAKEKRKNNKESYEIQRKKITKIYKVTTITNRELFIFGLNEFSKINNLNRSKLSCVLTGTREHHRGLKIEKVDDSYFDFVTNNLLLAENELLSKKEVLQLGIKKNWENRRNKGK